MGNRPSDVANRRAAQLRARGLPITAPKRLQRRGVAPRELPLPPDTLPTQRLAELCDFWVMEAEEARHSPRTIQEREGLRDKLLWWLKHAGREQCGAADLRQFLAYVGKTPAPGEPRWGREHPKNYLPVRDTTLNVYHRNLTTLANWLVMENHLQVSPMLRVKKTEAKADQIETFTAEQVEAMLHAARQSYYPKRNEALVLFLYDTGARCEETCTLKIEDVDFRSRRAYVLGKGRKRRMLKLGRKTVRALWSYHQERPDTNTTRFFVADQGPLAGQSITENGLYQMVQRLGQAARITGVRCSPHTFRHTFAIEFLRNGGTIYALQELLGHTTLEMVKRYARLAEADIENEHDKASPADNLRRRKS